EFSPATQEGRLATAGDPYLLHVGSPITRKRMDVLLEVFAVVRERFPNLRLVQIGGTWTPAQQAQIEGLGIAGRVEQGRGLSRAEVADVYRKASLVLQTSEAEGFGLPVIEALACGSPVMASDIPTLREVGGEAVWYCPVADIGAWAESAMRVLS